MAFEQAAIKVVNEKEFGELRASIEQAFLPANVEQFLKRLDRKRVRIRDFDRVLSAKALEEAAGNGSGLNAQQLYQALTVSDRALIREFYLSNIEVVDIKLRHQFKTLYQYY